MYARVHYYIIPYKYKLFYNYAAREQGSPAPQVVCKPVLPGCYNTLHMQLKTIQTYAMQEWRRLALYAALFAGLGGLLFFQLPSLPGGYSSGELATAQMSAGWRTILDLPLNAPFLAAVRSLGYVMDNTMLAARIVAAVCGLGTLVLFYLLARHWHSERVAVFGTVLFGTSAWFLHIARFGTPEVLLFGLLALVACFIWLRRTASPWAVLAGFILAACFIYTPGMVWFLAIGAITQWKTLDRAFKKNLWAVTAGGVLLLAALVPLGMALLRTPELAKAFAGISLIGWPEPLAVVRNLLEIPVQLFIHGPTQPEIWLGRVPILDYFTAGMFFLGAYLYVRHARLGRFWLLASAIILSALLVGLKGGVTITILMPFVYLIAASGVGFMLDRWNSVFPRNVIARWVGYSMLIVAVGAVCAYSFRHYFVAWPEARPTRATYSLEAR